MKCTSSSVSPVSIDSPTQNHMNAFEQRHNHQWDYATQFVHKQWIHLAVTVKWLNSMPLCLTYKAMPPPTHRYQSPRTQSLSHLLYCQNTLFRTSFNTILASGKRTSPQIRWLPPRNLSIITVFHNSSSHPPHPITAMASMITSNKLCPLADGIKLKCVDKNFYVVTFALFVVVCLSVVTIGGVKLRRRMMMR